MTFSSSTRRRPSSPELFVLWHQEIANERGSEKEGGGGRDGRENERSGKKIGKAIPGAATKVSHKGEPRIRRQRRRDVRLASLCVHCLVAHHSPKSSRNMIEIRYLSD